MFLGYGISGYPTTLVLERGVADDINGIDDSDYIIKAKDKDELKYYFETIIKSAPVIDVLQDIANAARIRIEKKNPAVILRLLGIHESGVRILTLLLIEAYISGLI